MDKKKHGGLDKVSSVVREHEYSVCIRLDPARPIPHGVGPTDSSAYALRSLCYWRCVLT